MMRLASILLLLEVSALATIIDPTRRINWQGNVGVEGGIPNRTTIFARVTDAPYNADPTGVVDATTTINNALAACPSNQVVFLPAGKFLVGGQLQMKTGVTLRGAGMTNTLILNNGGNPIKFFNANDVSFDQPLTAGFNKGSTNLTLASAANYSVGHIVLVDQLTDTTVVNRAGFEGDVSGIQERVFQRCQGQYSEVKAKSGNVLTVWPPLSWEFTNSLAPACYTEIGGGQGALKYAGVESLTITNTRANNVDVSMVMMTRTANCWLKDVEMRRGFRFNVTMRKCFRTEIRGCTFRDTSSTAPGSSSAYNVHGDYTTSFSLIEDNISHGMLNMSIWEYNSSHNVVAYNFTTNMVYYDPTWLATDYSIHAQHPAFNLYEGNIGNQFSGDMYHGSGSHNTLFRNYLRGKVSGKTDHRICVEIDAWHRYYNLVGNVLGNENWNNTTDYYERSGGVVSYGSDATIYRLGYWTVSSSTQNYDYGLVATLLRHGNWDSRDENIIWDSAIADHVLPASFYLASKPGWWGTNFAWPSIGTDLAPMIGSIPAERRYLGIPEGGGGTTPAVRTLTIASSNPSSGVSITVGPADNNAQANGTTSFSRLYNDGTSVTLIAPSAAGGNNFSKWQKDGVDYSAAANTTVSANADMTMTAVYATPLPPNTNKVTMINVRVVR